MRDPHAVLSAEELLAQVWDENADPFTNTVTVTMSRLRHKLGEPSAIETITNVGYRITEGGSPCKSGGLPGPNASEDVRKVVDERS